MKLKDVFGEIESDGANLVHGRLLEWALTPPLWHAEAVGGRPHHQALVVVIGFGGAEDLARQRSGRGGERRNLDRLVHGCAPSARSDRAVRCSQSGIPRSSAMHSCKNSFLRVGSSAMAP